MNHPTREEWMSYLYDELTADERANLETHLQSCPDCAMAVNDWQTTRAGLESWRLRPRARRSVLRARAGTALKWAAAAAVVLGVGFGAGRMATPAADIRQLRAVMEPEIREQLRSARAEWRQEFAQALREELDKSASATLAASTERTGEMLADFAQTLEARRVEENRVIYAALQRMQSQRDADFVLLKKDVDTVAVNAEQQLSELAGLARP